MEIPVKINPDANGYTGRECPQCERYFKIKFGTGIPGVNDCHCPYCNHVGSQNTFWTKQQVEYAKSVALNQISSEIVDQLKQMERKPDPNAFISIGITVKGNPIPITYYAESDLEQIVVCTNCTMDYTIYGAFGFCPDCGTHNSLQILDANLDLVLKVLELAASTPDEIKVKLIENALEDAISAFDGFGREHCLNLTTISSFQNIANTKDKLVREHNIDISKNLSEKQWQFLCTQFQKRHLLAHRMGVIDEEYINRTNTPSEYLGRKATITDSDVRELLQYLRVVSRNLTNVVTRS